MGRSSTRQMVSSELVWYLCHLGATGGEVIFSRHTCRAVLVHTSVSYPLKNRGADGCAKIVPLSAVSAYKGFVVKVVQLCLLVCKNIYT